MRKWRRSKQAAWGEIIVSLAGGGLITFLNPAYGIPILLVLLFFGVWLIWQAYKKQPIELVANTKDNRLHSHVAWKVYDNLEIAFRDLIHTKDKRQRENIFNRIEKERGKLPDKRLDKMINLFLSAESELTRYGVDPDSDEVGYLLSLHNERMRNRIKGKYGDR